MWYRSRSKTCTKVSCSQIPRSLTALSTSTPKNGSFSFTKIINSSRNFRSLPVQPNSPRLSAYGKLTASVLPVFRHDEGILNYGIKSDTAFILPAGPNNPVGILWMALSKPHVGIHGTNQPETIGRAASHGCIRTANWDAARVKELVTVGNVVSIF